STSVPAQAPTTATTAPGPRTSLSSPPTTVEEGIAEWFLRRKMKQPLPPGHYPDAGDDESNIKTVDSGRRAFADTPWNRDPRTEQLMKEKRIEELIPEGPEGTKSLPSLRTNPSTQRSTKLATHALEGDSMKSSYYTAPTPMASRIPDIKKASDSNKTSFKSALEGDSMKTSYTAPTSAHKTASRIPILES